MDLASCRIAIIDFGMGNLRSVEKAFHKVGALGAFVTDDVRKVAEADKAVLPGDGAFDSTLRSMERSGAAETSLSFIASGRPFLGICVGMQALFTDSEEGEAGVKGLNVVPGHVHRFVGGDGRKVPQIGWNNVLLNPDSPMARGIDLENAMAYFLHSYYCLADNAADVAASTEYGVTYCSAVEHDNVWATQFHPEKSGPIGLAILRNFARL